MHAQAFITPALLAAALSSPALAQLTHSADSPSAAVQSTAHTFDLLTGEESYTPLPFDPTALSRSFAAVDPHGAEPLQGPPELMGDEWLLDLFAVSSQSYPYSSQCRIFVDKAAGTVVGSGTIVDAKHIITAGHVVWDAGANDWGSNIRVFPSWDGDSDAYGSAQAVRLASFTGWTQDGNSDHDMGMIEFDRPLGFLTGTFGMGWDTNDLHYTSVLWNRAGYPGASTCYAGVPNQLYYGAGTFDTVNTFQLIADLYWSCIAGGMSGAGVYEVIGNSRYVHAVSRATGNVGSTPMTKYDTRMTQGKFDFFVDTFIPDSYSDTEMDMVPLNVTVDTGGGPIGAGETVDAMSYFLANASNHADLFQLNLVVDVYLSEDDNVTLTDTKIGSHIIVEPFSPMETLTVNPVSLPTLPANLASGTYWVGVHVKRPDADSSNNITTGWDAAEIEVNARWPELPSTFKNVADGLYAPLDSSPWLNPSIAMMALDPHSRETHPNAWCNAGQFAAPIHPFSGAQNVEMGLAPGSSTELVSNGFVMALDGNGHSDLVLDFMALNYGEEAHTDDGIYVSANGLDWEEIYGDWSPVSNVWTPVRGLALNSTGVDTSGEFYLLFGEQDNTAFGGLDGISLDDIQVHPPGPSLSVTDLTGGDYADIVISDGTTGGLAALLFSATGDGPLPSSLGPVLLADPVYIVPGLPLGANGVFGFTTYIDPALTGVPLWFQALDVSSELLSNPVGLVVN